MILHLQTESMKDSWGKTQFICGANKSVETTDLFTHFYKSSYNLSQHSLINLIFYGKDF